MAPPLASLSQKQLLHLCATADAESDFPARLVAALEAELSRPTAQALPLLNALCEFACRSLPGSDGNGAHFQQRVVELLQLALDKSVCAAAEGGQAAERIFAVVESLNTSASATSKLSKPGLRRICSYLLIQRRHMPRLAALMSRGPRLHEACAGATADTLEADDAGAASALSLLAAASRQMRYAAVASQPAAAVHGLQFLVEVGRRCPLTLAAGLDCGGVADLLGETIQTLHVKPAAAAKKLAVELMGGLLQALPVQLLEQSSLQQAAQALLGRAADGAVDATARAIPNPNPNPNPSPSPSPNPNPNPNPDPNPNLPPAHPAAAAALTLSLTLTSCSSANPNPNPNPDQLLQRASTTRLRELKLAARRPRSGSAAGGAEG